MNKLTALLLTLALIPLAGCTSKEPTTSAKAPTKSPATTTAPPHERPAPPTKEQVAAALASKYDIDKDKLVTPQEMLTVTTNDLLKHSSRKDGTLNRAEFHRALGDMSAEDSEIKKLFGTVDLDSNGSLAERELSAYIWPSISTMGAAPLKK